MKRPVILGGLAALLVVAYELARLAGVAEHTSAIAGMPRDASSWVLGPMYVLLYLLTVTVAPILALTAALDLPMALTRRRVR